MRRTKLYNPGSPSHLNESEESIVFEANPNKHHRRRAGTEDSADTFTSSSSSSGRQYLADALKDCGDFHFDMSDRWRTALMESLDQPMFPDDERVPRHRRLRKGVTNFVKKRAQGLRRDHRKDTLDHQPPVSPLPLG
mmetsp:Transcript_5793/g.13689  ORF Transcript_5793/g.13689 Transcript_5793/m.13689 type:complete len:137 (-) Transcript_5793:190-600(-)